jgi:hypothetical protein
LFQESWFQVIWFCTVGWTAGARSAAPVDVVLLVDEVVTLGAFVRAVDAVLPDDAVGVTVDLDLVGAVAVAVEERPGDEVAVDGLAVLEPVGVLLVLPPEVGVADGELVDVPVEVPGEVVVVVVVSGGVVSGVVVSTVDVSVLGAVSVLVGSVLVVGSVDAVGDASGGSSEAAPSGSGSPMVTTGEDGVSVPVSASATDVPPSTRAVLIASTRIGRIADRSRERAVTDMRL